MSEPPTEAPADVDGMVRLLALLANAAQARNRIRGSLGDDPAARERIIRAHAAADSDYVHTRNSRDDRPDWAVLTWTEVPLRTGVWTSDNGVFSVVRVTLPTRKPDYVYVLLERDPEGAAAWGPEYAGYAADVTCTVGYAMDAADRRDWRNRHPGALSVPEDYDAVTVDHFFWPISEGTSRGALVTEMDERGHLWAGVIGMSRTTGDEVEPGDYATVDVTRVVFANTPLRLLLRLLVRRLAQDAYAPYGRRRAARRAKRAFTDADQVLAQLRGGLARDPGAARGGLELRPITIRPWRTRARRWAARLNIRRGRR